MLEFPTKFSTKFPTKTRKRGFWDKLYLISRSDYVIVGTGDFNQDGKTDLLWQYANPGGLSDGMLAVWYMDGLSMTSSTLLNPSFPSNPKWRVVGTGD